MKIIDAWFTTQLVLETVDNSDSEWKVLNDFPVDMRIEVDIPTEIYFGMQPTVLKQGLNEVRCTVPAGFLTDLASVPRLPGMFLFFGGKARKASVPHDYLYSIHQGDRDIPDQLFFKLMSHEENWFTRTLMWAGVRVGGWAIWNKRQVPEIAPTPTVEVLK